MLCMINQLLAMLRCYAGSNMSIIELPFLLKDSWREMVVYPKVSCRCKCGWHMCRLHLWIWIPGNTRLFSEALRKQIREKACFTWKRLALLIGSSGTISRYASQFLLVRTSQCCTASKFVPQSFMQSQIVWWRCGNGDKHSKLACWVLKHSRIQTFQQSQLWNWIDFNFANMELLTQGNN